MEPVVIGRPIRSELINGIPLHGWEFLLEEPYIYKEFKDIEAAKEFIREEIFPDSTDEEIEGYFTFMTKQEAIEYTEKRAQEEKE